MRRAFALLGLLSTLAAATSAGMLATSEESRAAGRADATFVVPANDGYGFGECLTGASSCGKVIADSWCEAQGFRKAVSFNLVAAEDVTGAITVQPVPRSTQPVSITCSD
jgi:hypothetical protein